MISPEQFAVNLLRQTVTPDRVAAVMARIAGERILVGPLRFGPGGAVSARGEGIIGRINVTAAASSGPGGIGFDAAIPGDLTIDLTVGGNGRVHRYHGTVLVPLRIAVDLLPPARVLLAVTPLAAKDVTVRLDTAGMATFVLQTLGDADREVAGQVAAVVNERVAAVAHLREIDIAALLDRAWETELVDLESRLP